MNRWIEKGKQKSHIFNRLLKALHPDKIFNQFTRIRNKIFSLTFLLLIIFGVMAFFVFHLLSAMYEEKIYEESAQNLNLSSHVLDEQLSRIEDLSFQLSTENFTQAHLEFLKEDNLSFQAYRAQADLIEMMTVTANQRSYISSIRMIDASGKILEVRKTAREPEDLADRLDVIEEANGGNVWMVSEENQTLLSAREINSKENVGLQHLGYLVISIELDSFIDGLLNVANTNFIITKENEIIYADESFTNGTENILNVDIEEGFEIAPIGEEEYLITSQNSATSDITYYNMRPFENVVSTKEQVTRLMLVYFLLIMVLTVFISRKSAYAISKPIEQLTQKMKQVQNGNFTPLAGEDKPYLKDEIGDLQRNFHIMLDKINQLIKENYTKQLLIKETEYKALQSQINPHFLYNTLDSINWMAKMNDQEKISNMVEALGNMMRNIISKKAALISIKEELEIINHYITIQKYRYGKRLHFDLEYDSALEAASIPKLTIQPLVENAIQHGLEEMLTDCCITVRVFFEDDLLNITVSDNGPGMEQQTIEQIYSGKIKPKGSGIGLFNIMERIELMFGEKYKAKIDSELGKGTTVKITLPFMEG